MAALPLSVLIDQLEADVGARDRAFVRGLSLWLHQNSAHLQLDVVERLGLENVVVTFQMTGDVKLIITGSRPDSPGEISVKIAERDFPHVNILLAAEPLRAPYEMCTLDYSLAGKRVRVTGQHPEQEGEIVVAATVGDRQQHKVRLADGRVVTLDGDALELLT